MNFSIIKILVTFFLIFTSCQKNHEPVKNSQHLRINIIDEVQSLDPRQVRDLNSIAVMKMLYEGLTRISKNGGIELALAKDVTLSKDCKTYTFILKETYWSDGSVLTSYDIANSWREALSSSFTSVMSYKLYNIEGAKRRKAGENREEDVKVFTPDASTLIVTLEQPTPYFLELVSMPVFFPVKEKIKEEFQYLANGPFIIKQWKLQNCIELEKNKKYWEAEKVKLDGISLFMVVPDTELNMFETRKIDWAGSPFSSLPVDAIGHLTKSNNFGKQPFLGTSFLRVNTRWCNKVFKSEEKGLSFRKALASSIDKRLIAKHVLHSSAVEATGLIPSMKLKNIEFENIFNNYEFLQQNQTHPIKISFVNNEKNYLIIQALQRQLAKQTGIKVELEPLEAKIYYQNLLSGKYQLALGSWIADFNDSMNFLEVFKYANNGINNTFWENKEYIDLLNRADICIDKEERNIVLNKAHLILMEALPIIPLFHLNMCYLKDEKVKGVVISPIGNVDYRWAYIKE